MDGLRRVFHGGQRVGEWTIIKRVSPDQKGNACWLCRCSCGRESVVKQFSLGVTSNRCVYCGRRMTKPKHGLLKHPLYKIWGSMKRRCYEYNYGSWKYYGGKGIKICEEWLKDFLCFYQWSMEHGWKPGLQIDRMDGNSNYAPENCRWVNTKEQQRNRSNNVLISINGENKTASAWSEITGINAGTIYTRYKYSGYVGENIIKPVRRKHG